MDRTRTRTRRLPSALAAAAALAALSCSTLVGPGAGAASAEAATPVAPGSLTRGADPAVPVLAGRTITDGERTVRVPGRSPSLLGASGDGYVVTTGLDGRRPVLLLDGSGRHTLVDDLGTDDARLASDGSVVALTRYRFAAQRSRVRVLDVATGSIAQRRGFEGFANVLDADATRVVVSTFPPRATMLWDLAADRVELVGRQPGYAASLADDRLAVYTGDPYRGGCSRVVRLQDPSRTLWRSCEERVTAFAPGGERLATVGLLADGRGPQDVWARATDGTLLEHYTVAGWFGLVQWEDATGLLLDSHGVRRAALVRCDTDAEADATDGGCERAGDLRAVTAGS